MKEDQDSAQGLGRDQCGSRDDISLGATAALAGQAVAILDRWMARCAKDDDQPHHHHTGKIANALGVNKGTARRLLDDLADQGRIKRLDFANGIAWRSVNPLPHEPGGTIWLSRQRYNERRPVTVIAPTFILQREIVEGGRGRWFDDETFPNEERARSALSLARSSAQYQADQYDVRRAPQRIRIVIEMPDHPTE